MYWKGDLDCRKEDMTENEFEKYFVNNVGKNCPYYEQYGECTEQRVYDKAIDDCIKQHNHTITKDCLFWLKRKLEQLKGTDRK